MNEIVREKNNGRVNFFVWLEGEYYRLSNKVSFYTNFFKDRMAKTGWTILFSVLFLYFVHSLCFVDEKHRLSNEYTKMGAFLMALFLILSTV